MYIEDEYGQNGECGCGGCSLWPNCSGCATNPIYDFNYVFEPIKEDKNMKVLGIKEFLTLKNLDCLYHATILPNVNSIKKFGLGAKFPNKRLWNYDGSTYKNIKQGVFLASDEYVAESYVENADYFDDLSDAYEERYNKELEIIVFEVKISDLDLNLLSIDENNQDDEDPTFFYSGVIPFDKLRKIDLA